MIYTAKIDDFTMDYYRFGSGPKSFVIIPGVSISPVTPIGGAVANAYKDFTEDYTVYLLDRRANAPEGYTAKQMAADSVAVLKSLGIEKISIFGASQGGQIAMEIAVDFPDYVEKLVLGSTAAKATELSLEVIGGWIELAKGGLNNADKLNEAITDAVYSEASLEKFRDVILDGTGEITTEKLVQFVKVASAINDFDLAERLPEIQAETLVLGSERDGVFGGEASRLIAEKLGCELYLYGAQYGHAVYDEAPDYVARVLAFLKGRKPVKNIIFDMGNVLIYFKPRLFVERLGLGEEDTELLLERVYRSKEWTYVDSGEKNEDQVVELIRRNVPVRLHKEVDLLVNHWDEPILPYPGMAEELKKLHEAGYKLYLLSNAGSGQHGYWPRVPGHEYFEGTVISADEKIAKPDPRIFKLILDRFSLLAEECAFVDDSAPNVCVADSLGMRGVVFAGNAEQIENCFL